MTGNWLEVYWIVRLRQKELIESAELRQRTRDMRMAARAERARARAAARQAQTSQMARASLAILQDCGKTGGPSIREEEGARVSGDC